MGEFIVLWIKLGLMILISSIIISIVKLILRKVFKIEKVKKAFFSDNYINDLHRKIDKKVRNISAITLGILIFIQFSYYEDLIYLFPIGAILYTALIYSVTVFIEWKYSAYPKQAILTITEIFLVSLAIILVFQFELLD